MSIQNTKTLHKAQTQASVGDTLGVYSVDTVIVGITGTSTTFTAKFEASLDGVNYFGIEGFKISDSSVMVNSTSVVGEAWCFDVSLFGSFRVNLTSISNGNVTITANSGNVE